MLFCVTSPAPGTIPISLSILTLCLNNNSVSKVLVLSAMDSGDSEAQRG